MKWIQISHKNTRRTKKCLGEKGLKGNVEKFRNKKKWADTLNNKVNELKGDVDKFMNKNTWKEYMTNNKNTPRVTRTKKYWAKKLIICWQIMGKFIMHSWRKETKLKALVFTLVDKLENSECRNI